MPDVARSLYADNSTVINRFYVPLQLRHRVFDELNGLSHPGIRATKQLMGSKYIWPDMNKDVGVWCRACINCQRSKVQLHTETPLVQFLIPDERFAHVHLDIIKLPLVRGYKYCLTMIDRFTRWPEAAPMSDMEAETVFRAFVNTWISRFGTPQRLTCDRGGQFESGLFETLSKLLGVHLTRTASYTPQCNGMVERLHRPLKQALTCHQADWLGELPLVLLGIRTVLREDLNASAAELVYGSSLRLPGQLYEEKRIDQCPDYEARLQRLFRAVSPTFPLRHGPQRIYIPKDLETCSHVFLRRPPFKKTLQTPYEGPFKVVRRLPKDFIILIKGQERLVAMDHLKPAFILNGSDEPTEQPDVTRNCGTDLWQHYITEQSEL
ncbi:Gag-Pol polyprotein [Araneus ventricosus]|uniref:Gag-Pol polyprotein n=1 Tax=Araneus ventricosus TaxID=182803 RepID=A0A4Y2ECG5_ARAVE|nr:Gag-Pol polyprotein [Araneus ventricosus]